MPHTPVDQRALDRLQEVLISWNNNPHHTTTRYLINQAISHHETTPYFEALYRLLLLTAIRVNSEVGEYIPENLTNEAIECLKVVRILRNEGTVVENAASINLLVCGYGIVTCVGGSEILETWKIGSGVVGKVWQDMSKGVTKLDFARKMLAQHNLLVQADSRFWKAEFQPTRAQAANRKISLRRQAEVAKAKVAAEKERREEEE